MQTIRRSLEHDHGKIELKQVLLKREVAVHGDEHLEPFLRTPE